ncbi:unnamed protein product [Fraxinus pennsylvanica]|uniref:t-SNARE coiled-coil homology domain-containing protein n=1 Tax=Fraxinus pennsylvanica TaxID=56036 RepID=A0AAD2A1R7_9LAMI|nr:unnamed protein product [Fraxinus pennsylvanica]
MNDLLTDSFEIPRDQASRNGDIEMGTQIAQNSGDLGLDNFFKQVQEIEKHSEKLDKLLKKLQDAHEESKAVTKAAAMKAIKKRMEKDVDEVGKIARLIKSKIEELDKENLANRQKPGCGKGSGVDRSRTATTVAMKKKFKDKMSEFQTLRESIHQEYREVVERRVFTVTGNRADEETIDRLIETGDSEQIFHKAIQEQGRGQIMDTLAEIQERHGAVRDLEKKLLDLQQIFMDMAVLVDAQGDMLDNIESQVSSAVDHVQSGNTALQKAKSLQKNSRKWMCIAILILLIIVAIIVVGVLKPWQNNNVISAQLLHQQSWKVGFNFSAWNLLRGMDGVPVFVKYNGRWDENNIYVDHEMTGVLVPLGTSYVGLLEILYDALGLGPLSQTIRMKYIAEVGSSPIEISQDRDVFFYLNLKERDAQLNSFPICLEIKNEPMEEILPLALEDNNHSSDAKIQSPPHEINPDPQLNDQVPCNMSLEITVDDVPSDIKAEGDNALEHLAELIATADLPNEANYRRQITDSNVELSVINGLSNALVSLEERSAEGQIETLDSDEDHRMTDESENVRDMITEVLPTVLRLFPSRRKKTINSGTSLCAWLPPFKVGNIVDLSINATDVQAKDMPITSLIEWLMSMVRRWFSERRSAAESTTTMLATAAEDRLREQNALSLSMTVHPANTHEFHVLDPEARSFVNWTVAEAPLEEEEEEVALVAEDWRLTQFWHDFDTTETIAREVIILRKYVDSPSVACIAFPTLYAHLKKIGPEVLAQLLESNLPGEVQKERAAELLGKEEMETSNGGATVEQQPIAVETGKSGMMAGQEPEGKKMMNIMVGIDDSDESFYALEWVLDELLKYSGGAAPQAVEELEHSKSPRWSP